jgi:hypothetical protein
MYSSVKLKLFSIQHLEKDNEHQSVAVLGIALIAMTEDIGIQMVLRAFDRLLQYGEQNIRKAVPLAIALLCAGNPEITVMDILSKLSHDHDAEVAQGAIFALGMIGVGTNNSRFVGSFESVLSVGQSSHLPLLFIELLSFCDNLLHITIRSQTTCSLSELLKVYSTWVRVLFQSSPRTPKDKLSILPLLVV